MFSSLCGRELQHCPRRKVGRAASSHLPAAGEEQLADPCVATKQGAMPMGKVRGDCKTRKNLFEDLSTHLYRCGIA